jgi:hypothetical protein
MDSSGYDFQVNYAPTAIGNDTAIVTVSGGGLAVPYSVNVAGKAWAATEVATLAALRAAYDTAPTDETTIYRITGEVFATFSHSSGNSKYFQDATGGILIYDSKKTITTTLNRGDGVKNLTGTFDTYSGVTELIPVADVTLSSTETVIHPVLLTIPGLKANKERYESVLVQLNDLNNLTASTTWSTSKANYNFAAATDTIVIRTNYTGLDYMSKPIPTIATNYAGLVLEYNGTVQICPRDSNDIGVPAVPNGLSKPVKSVATVYGSNGVLNVQASQGQLIEVYNILGRKVLSATAKEGTNTFTLGSKQLLLVKVGKTTSKIVL